MEKMSFETRVPQCTSREIKIISLLPDGGNFTDPLYESNFIKAMAEYREYEQGIDLSALYLARLYLFGFLLILNYFH